MLIVWQWPDVKGGTPVVVRDRGKQVVKCPQHLVKRQAGHLVAEARVTLTGASIFETRVTSQGRYYKEHFLEDPFCTVDRIKKYSEKQGTLIQFDWKENHSGVEAIVQNAQQCCPTFVSSLLQSPHHYQRLEHQSGKH